jgi:hypothetical protein
MDAPSVRSRATRAGLALACAGFVGVLTLAPTHAWSADAPTTTAEPAKPAKAGKKGGKGTKASAAKKKKADAEAAAVKRRRFGANPAYIVGDSDPHLIDENAPQITPFGEDHGAVKKAFAETRREQIVDAEKAAREAKTPDRWRTVLFMLRGLPEANDPEVCFWRVLSFFRLGEVERARKLREGCEFNTKDGSTLNAEDALASGIAPTELASHGPAQEADLGALRERELVAAGAGGTKNAKDKPSTPPVTPYTGSAPAHKD